MNAPTRNVNKKIKAYRDKHARLKAISNAKFTQMLRALEQEAYTPVTIEYMSAK